MKIKRNFSHRGNRRIKEAMFVKTNNRVQNLKGTSKKKS